MYCQNHHTWNVLKAIHIANGKPWVNFWWRSTFLVPDARKIRKYSRRTDKNIINHGNARVKSVQSIIWISHYCSQWCTSRFVYTSDVLDFDTIWILLTNELRWNARRLTDANRHRPINDTICKLYKHFIPRNKN